MSYTEPDWLAGFGGVEFGPLGARLVSPRDTG
jgi:hypothetical protein